jgi:hypothetical protein
MRYDRVLRLALVPSIIFFVLSLVSVALTAHYWIIGDWIVPRGVQVVTSEFNDRLQQYVIDDTIVYFTEADTDATIASGCLNLTAAVVALIAWSTLRKKDIDSQSAVVRIDSQHVTLIVTDVLQSKRRFWILSIVVTTIAGAAAALASIVLHYTEQGDDQYGCRPERLMMTGKMNTNQYCTREVAACTYQPKFIKKKHRETSIACNEAVSIQDNILQHYR